MRILWVSSEVAPYSETGGLADVSGALPERLRERGHDVLTVTPLYRQVDRDAHGLVPHVAGGTIRLGSRALRWATWRDPSGCTLFVDVPELYGRAALYGDDPDEHVRFAALSHLALEACSELGWAPDVIHCHDWQAALVPALLRGRGRPDPVVGAAATTLTVHNLGYQGRFGVHVLPELGLAAHEHLLDQQRLADGEVNLLAAGLLNADLVTTVSPTYAREIQTPEGGAGLDSILASRPDGVVGILNGIDTREWNPRTDRLIPWRYSQGSLWRKERNKRALLERMRLPYREAVPVIGVISRLVLQKGIELMRGPLLHLLDTWDLRLVVLGEGESRYEDLFRWLADTFFDRVAFVNGFDRELAHLIEAGADMFLMPSLYEPCGLNQMYSLAYGTAPVVRRVGGLADTVRHFDPATGVGTGFVFEHYTEDGLGWAIGQALTLHTDLRSFRILQRNAMSEDNSWESRAGEYEEAYALAVEARGRRLARDPSAG